MQSLLMGLNFFKTRSIKARSIIHLKKKLIFIQIERQQKLYIKVLLIYLQKKVNFITQFLKLILLKKNFLLAKIKIRFFLNQLLLLMEILKHMDMYLTKLLI